MSGFLFRSDLVARFSTRELARRAIRRDGLDRRRWKATKRAQVWVITSPGPCATWDDLPLTVAANSEAGS